MAIPTSVLSNPRSIVEIQEALSLPGTTDQSSRDVQVQLNYLKSDAIYVPKPIQITPSFLDVERRTNVRLQQGPVETIRDVRGREKEFSMDANGFSYVHAPTEFQQWSSHANIAQEYLPELELLLRREIDGCDEIMFYDARIRHADDAGLRVQGLSYSPWAMQVHCDNTDKSVLAKIKDLTDIKSEFLLRGRVRIVNIWRPIRHSVYDCALAVADRGKLQAGDVIECDRHRQDTGEYWDTMGVVKFREGFEWFYKHQQSEDDVLLFKNYDNTTSVHVKARTCLHTAFEIPRKDVPAGAPTRESIEVRALIFTYPENEARPPSARTLPISHAGGSLQRAVESISHERTDIDEGNEIKDAVLMLRRQEIQRLKEEKESLREERESLAVELKLSQTQVGKLLAKTQDLSRRLVAAGGTLGSSNFAAAGSLNVCVLGTDNHTGPA